MLEVIPLSLDHWPLLKAVRLRALADAPEAFSTTLTQARAWSDGEWQERARRFALRPPATAYIALRDGNPCGMVSCYSSEADSPAEGSAAELTAFWVAPEQRGQGVGEALIARVVNWAMTQSIVVLHAQVMEDNRRAVAFFGKAGFRETGQRQPPTPDTSKQTILLSRSLETPTL